MCSTLPPLRVRRIIFEETSALTVSSLLLSITSEWLRRNDFHSVGLLSFLLLLYNLQQTYFQQLERKGLHGLLNWKQLTIRMGLDLIFLLISSGTLSLLALTWEVDADAWKTRLLRSLITYTIGHSLLRLLTNGFVALFSLFLLLPLSVIFT